MNQEGLQEFIKLYDQACEYKKKAERRLKRFTDKMSTEEKNNLMLLNPLRESIKEERGKRDSVRDSISSFQHELQMANAQLKNELQALQQKYTEEVAFLQCQINAQQPVIIEEVSKMQQPAEEEFQLEALNPDITPNEADLIITLNQQILDLQARIQELENTQSKVDQEKSVFQKTIAEQQMQLNWNEEQQLESDQQLQDTSKLLNELQAQVEENTKSDQRNQNLTTDLKQQIDTKTYDLSQLEQQLTETIQQLNQVNSNKVQQQLTHQDLLKSKDLEHLRAIEQLKTNYQSQITENEEEITKLQKQMKSEKESFNTELESMNSFINQEKSSNINLQSKLDEFRAKNQEQCEEIEQLSSNFNNLQVEYQKTQELSIQLTQDNQSNQEEIKDLKEDNAALDTQNSLILEREKQQNHLQQEGIANLSRILEQQKKEYQSLCEQNTKLEINYTSAQDQLLKEQNATKTLVLEYDQQFQKQKTDYETQYSKSIEISNQIRTKLTEKVKSIQEQLTLQTQKNQELLNCSKLTEIQYKMEIEELNQRISEQETQYSLLQKEIQSIKDQYESQINMMKLQALQESITSPVRESKFQELYTQLTSRDEQIAKSQFEITTLNEKITQLEQFITEQSNQYEKQLKKTQTELQNLLDQEIQKSLEFSNKFEESQLQNKLLEESFQLQISSKLQQISELENSLKNKQIEYEKSIDISKLMRQRLTEQINSLQSKVINSQTENQQEVEGLRKTEQALLLEIKEAKLKIEYQQYAHQTDQQRVLHLDEKIKAIEKTHSEQIEALQLIYQHKISELQAQLKDAINQQSEYKLQIQDLEIQKLNLNSQLIVNQEQYQNQIDYMQKIINNQYDKIENITNNESELIEYLQTQIQSQSEYNRLEVLDKNFHLQNMANQIVEFNKKCDRQQLEINSLNDKIYNLKQTHQEEFDQINIREQNHISELGNAQKSIYEQNQMFLFQQKTINMFSNQKLGLSQQLDNQNAQLSELTDKLQEYEKIISSLNDKIQKIEEQLLCVKLESSNLINFYYIQLSNQQQTHIQEIKGKESSQSHIISELRQQSENYNQQIQSLETLKDGLEIRVSELISDLNSKLNEKDQKLSQIEQDLETQSLQLEQQQQKEAEKFELSIQQQAKYDELNHQFEYTKQENDSLLEQIINLQVKYQNSLAKSRQQGEQQSNDQGCLLDVQVGIRSQEFAMNSPELIRSAKKNMTNVTKFFINNKKPRLSSGLYQNSQDKSSNISSSQISIDNNQSNQAKRQSQELSLYRFQSECTPVREFQHEDNKLVLSLQTQVEELKQQKIQAQVEKSKLLRQLMNQNKVTELQIESLTSQCETMSHLYNTNSSEVIQDIKLDSTSQTDKLHQDNSKLTQQNQILENECNSLNTQITKLKQQIDSLIVSNQNLDKDKQQLTQKLQQDLTKLRLESENILEQSRSNYEKEISQLREIKDHLKESNDQLIKALNTEQQSSNPNQTNKQTTLNNNEESNVNKLKITTLQAQIIGLQENEMRYKTNLNKNNEEIKQLKSQLIGAQLSLDKYRQQPLQGSADKLDQKLDFGNESEIQTTPSKISSMPSSQQKIQPKRSMTTLTKFLLDRKTSGIYKPNILENQSQASNDLVNIVDHDSDN